MDLEEKKVLRSRNPVNVLFREWRHKEWWYTGAYDAAAGVYVSWHFVRVNFADQFTITIFDPAGPEPLQLEKLLWLDAAEKPGSLCLRYDRPELRIVYEGDEEAGWRFELESPELRARIDIRATIPCFTKFDNEVVEYYGLLHYFHNLASGTVEAGGRTYRLENARTYYDHCWGRVPSQTGWHWLAVQNPLVALSCLVNYGPYAQRYTQAWFSKDTASPRREQWVRLEQSASFEHRDAANRALPWKVTSSDMELEVEPIQQKTNRTRIPPFSRFLVDLHHTELFVRARGKLRVDGTWIEVADLCGVMEEHYGRW